MADTCITPQQVAELEARCEGINERTPMPWAVFYNNQDWMHVNFKIATPGDDVQVDPVSNYLVENYSTAATSVPNFVRCEGYEEALYFLSVFEKRANDPTPFSYQAVCKIAADVEREGMMDAWYSFTDDDQGWEKGELTDGEIIYWWRESLPRWAGENDMVMTASWSNGYCHYGEIPQPDTPDCLLFAIQSTGGQAETEVEWETGHDDNRGLGEDSLEEFLCLQLLCWRNSARSDKRSEGEPAYVFVQYALIAGAWAKPTWANIEYFERIIRRDDCESYHKHKEDWDDWEANAHILRWLRAAYKDAVDSDEEEWADKAAMYRIAFNDPELADHEDLPDMYGKYMNWKSARYQAVHGPSERIPERWNPVTDYAQDRKRLKEQKERAA